MNHHVWVFAEHKDGEVIESSLELICEGRRLAGQLKVKLCVIMLGHHISALAGSISKYGMDTVFVADHELFDGYRPECCTAVLAGLVKAYGPDIFLFSSTVVGQDLAPRVAAKLKTCLASDCDKFQISDEGLLLQIRLAYQNKLHTTVVSPAVKPQMATVTPGIAKVKKTATSPDFKVVPIDPVGVYGTGYGADQKDGFYESRSQNHRYFRCPINRQRRQRRERRKQLHAYPRSGGCTGGLGCRLPGGGGQPMGRQGASNRTIR